MKKRFTEQQIAYALKQAETGVSVQEVCRKLGIAEGTFYNWKKRYRGLTGMELRQPKQQCYIKSALNYLKNTSKAQKIIRELFDSELQSIGS